MIREISVGKVKTVYRWSIGGECVGSIGSVDVKEASPR